MGERPVNLAIAHANGLEEANRVADNAQTQLNVRELYLVEIGPAIASLAGPGTIAIIGHPADFV
jgi:fatty acid-binding protein DegV